MESKRMLLLTELCDCAHYKIHIVCFHIHKFLSSLVFNMKRLKILTTIYFLYFSGVLADPLIDDNETTNEAIGDEEEKETCDEIFANNEMNYTSFYEGAAHGIHSLRLNIMRCLMTIYIKDNHLRFSAPMIID